MSAPNPQPPTGGSTRPPVYRRAVHAAGRRHRFHDWPILIVLAGMSAGLIYTGMHHFKRGSVIVAAFVCLAALLRLVLPERAVGLLAVRSRVLDVVVTLTLGIAIGVVTVVVPPPS